MKFLFCGKKKGYTRSFPILGIRDSTTALQSSQFQNPVGIVWVWWTKKSGKTKEILMSNIGFAENLGLKMQLILNLLQSYCISWKGQWGETGRAGITSFNDNLGRHKATLQLYLLHFVKLQMVHGISKTIFTTKSPPKSRQNFVISPFLQPWSWAQGLYWQRLGCDPEGRSCVMLPHFVSAGLCSSLCQEIEMWGAYDFWAYWSWI